MSLLEIFEDVDQLGRNGTQVGLAIGTDSCNNGDQPIDWFALPNTDHPVVPQNLYRMSGGADNTERFEQIGQSWMKHTFLALARHRLRHAVTAAVAPGSASLPGMLRPVRLGPEWRPRAASVHARGSILLPDPSRRIQGRTTTPGHTHNRHVAPDSGGNERPGSQTQNPGATYFGEAAYITPHEYTWCQTHPGQCNMFNNVSYRQFTVSGGPTSFTFSPVGSTVRMQPAIYAWNTEQRSTRSSPIRETMALVCGL